MNTLVARATRDTFAKATAAILGIVILAILLGTIRFLKVVAFLTIAVFATGLSDLPVLHSIRAFVGQHKRSFLAGAAVLTTAAVLGIGHSIAVLAAHIVSHYVWENWLKHLQE